jgi:outer membrane protein assembly factor BamB
MTRLMPRLLVLSALILGLVALGLYTLNNQPTVPAPEPQPGPLTDPEAPTWTRWEPALELTWPDQPNFSSDAVRQPVIAGGKVLLTSSRHDDLTAASVKDGQTVWRFQAEGPIRFAPAVWQDRVYVTSDDGFLYCLSLEDGKLQWKVRGGPSDQLVLGNERLIHMWPARGGPAIATDGEQATVYFAAGIWPFMGIFLHAVDAQSGQVRWTNSGDGASFIKQPHNTDAFAGVAPQGQLVVHENYLLVPGGRSVPAVYDRTTGTRLHYRLAEAGKIGGGPDVLVAGDAYINGSGVFDLKTGKPIGGISGPVAVQGNYLYSIQAGVCRAFDLTKRAKLTADPPEPKRINPDKIPLETEAKADKADKTKTADKAKADKADKTASKSKTRRPPEAWIGKPAMTVEVPATLALLAVGERVYGAGEGHVYAIEGFNKGKPSMVWKRSFQGKAMQLAYADDTLVISTKEGLIHAFGPEAGTPRAAPEPQSLPEITPAGDNLLRSLMAASGDIREGYAIVHGLETDVLAELYRGTKLNLIVLEPDAAKRTALRNRLREANVDSKRLAVLDLSLEEAKLPPYLCTVIVVQGAVDETVKKKLSESLRPYGGTLCIRVNDSTWDTVRREGPLPGSANWTHQNTDAANTRVGGDTLVKAPLGVLWYGGPGNQEILPRHGHGPSPQAVDGRCIIEGMDMLRAIDVYTGRLLWTAKFPGLGLLYDNTAHQAGANGIGSNYVSLPEGVFVAHENKCHRLDPATGKIEQTYQMPAFEGEKAAPRWAFLNVEGDYLIGTASPTPAKEIKRKKGDFSGLESSQKVFVFNWRTGNVLFSAEATYGFRHNGIILGGGRLYLLDRTDKDPTGVLSITGTRGSVKGSVAAYDLPSGKEVWKAEKGTFGTYLSYSAKHDIVLESGIYTRDTLRDEARGIRALAGKDGSVLWNQSSYGGPAMIRGDWVLKMESRGNGGTACDIRTGKEITVPDPVTGKPIAWKWERTYGCNTPAASEHLMLFRSGAAGFYDLCSDSGTGNLGGFRSSCSLNLIPANGVLVAPDYTRTCVCNYQNQTSIALIHWPDNELWTFTTARTITAPVQKLGLNLGAPGSRKDENGTLWIEYPRVGGPSPRVGASSEPEEDLTTFRLHASQVQGPLSWVAASGIKDLQQLRIPLGVDKRPRAYTVRLHFLEPDGLEPGKRTFNVSLQDEVVLEKFDVSREAGGPGKPLVKQFKGVLASTELVLTFEGPAVLSGVELTAED